MASRHGNMYITVSKFTQLVLYLLFLRNIQQNTVTVNNNEKGGAIVKKQKIKILL